DVDAESEDELYEVVNITDYARRHQWWSLVFGNSTGPIAEKYSVASQIMMGGVTGWSFIHVDVFHVDCSPVEPLLLGAVRSTEFVKRNIVISGGFVGGFLLGLAS
ncbi:hypothetical protein cypCar_00002720, partial [Cyprinus carpio]